MHSSAQVNAEQVMQIGRNALYFEDYMLSIQYFNQAIAAKPYLAQPYFYRAVAKINLEDYRGAEADASKALELNPFLTDAWEARGVARQNLGKDREAISDYEEALKLLPFNKLLLLNKAFAQTEIKDYDGAKISFAELIKHYPSYDNAYIGRARLYLQDSDTVSALADIDKALSLNKNAINAYILRADIAINSQKDFESAEKDIDQAIRLKPRAEGLYINRAFLRYYQNNYQGAMADYDYALTLDPMNSTALFNRGLLLAEVSANDLALNDFTRVLELDPTDTKALYNRALIYEAKGNTAAAIEDITKVHEQFPDFPGALYLRSRLHRERGELKAAERDFKQAQAATKALDKYTASDSSNPSVAERQERSQDDTSRQFATLQTIDNTADFREEYNNTAIRGRIQDRNQNVETEGMMLLSFYNSPTELRRNTYYIKEVDDLNATRALRFVVLVTNTVPMLDETTVARHFQNIDYYNSYLASHQPRAIDYIGRAMDYITVRDYLSAEKDINRAIEMMPDNPVVYLMKAQAAHGRLELEEKSSKTSSADNSVSQTKAVLRKNALDEIEKDIDHALRLSPEMAVGWYNKGCVLFENNNSNAAIEAFSKAIELKPDFGEAYFNRGFVKLHLGLRQDGISDLSKAGEYGIVQAYNLIKRVDRQ